MGFTRFSRRLVNKTVARDMGVETAHNGAEGEHDLLHSSTVKSEICQTRTPDKPIRVSRLLMPYPTLQRLHRLNTQLALSYYCSR